MMKHAFPHSPTIKARPQLVAKKLLALYITQYCKLANFAAINFHILP